MGEQQLQWQQLIIISSSSTAMHQDEVSLARETACHHSHGCCMLDLSSAVSQSCNRQHCRACVHVRFALLACSSSYSTWRTDT
jgi:hypothetical protein